MTQPLNFLRQAREQMTAYWLPAIKETSPDDAQYCEELLSWSKEAPKFILPRGGRIFDNEFKALPEELNLPYPKIVIEYQSVLGEMGLAGQIFGDESKLCTKRILFVEQRENLIRLSAIFYYDNDRIWSMLPYFCVMGKDREEKQHQSPLSKKYNIPAIESVFGGFGKTGSIVNDLPNWETYAEADLSEEAGSVLSLIEALSCSNVSSESLPVQKQNKKKRDSALPFDEYRILVVKTNSEQERHAAIGSHRSPREHLRRGHIRRLADGRKIWIQSTIVNAGTAGKIHKSYRMDAK